MARRRKNIGEGHDADAFIRESEARTGSREDLSELLGEDFLRAATSGEEVGEDVRDEVVPEELGGPFLETDAGEEFGRTVRGLEDDEVEERDAESAAFPEAVGSLGVAAPDEREVRPAGEVLDDDQAEEEEELRQAEAEVPSEIEPDSEVLEPESEQSAVRKRY